MIKIKIYPDIFLWKNIAIRFFVICTFSVELVKSADYNYDTNIKGWNKYAILKDE